MKNEEIKEYIEKYSNLEKQIEQKRDEIKKLEDSKIVKLEEKLHQLYSKRDSFLLDIELLQDEQMTILLEIGGIRIE